MGLDAIALVRIVDLQNDSVRHRLADCVLIDTHIPFSAEPAQLAVALRMMLGAVLDEHHDARGVLVLPDVAVDHAVRAKTYDAVIEAIGELGQWVPVLAQGDLPAMPDMDALLGSPDMQAMLGTLQATLQNDPSAMAAMAQAAASAQAGGGMDMNALLGNPALMAAVQQMASALAADPEQMERMFAAQNAGLDEDAAEADAPVGAADRTEPQKPSKS